jgi:hypothetical protein
MGAYSLEGVCYGDYLAGLSYFIFYLDNFFLTGKSLLSFIYFLAFKMAFRSEKI